MGMTCVTLFKRHKAFCIYMWYGGICRRATKGIAAVSLSMENTGVIETCFTNSYHEAVGWTLMGNDLCVCGFGDRGYHCCLLTWKCVKVVKAWLVK